MTDAEADAAYLAEVLDGKPSLETAQTDVECACREALELGKALRDAERNEGRESASYQRLIAASFDARDRVHACQRKWMLRGFDVYVAHDRNGYPIKVDRPCRKSIIGFGL